MLVISPSFSKDRIVIDELTMTQTANSFDNILTLGDVASLEVTFWMALYDTEVRIQCLFSRKGFIQNEVM